MMGGQFETNSLKLLLGPSWGRGVKAVWRRNFLYFKYSFLVSIFWILLEPLFYLGAIGYGLGAFVSDIDGLSYVEYFFPGLICITAMFVPFFEATYGCFTKLTHQKTYSTILLTPVGVGELVWGEVLWCTSKGLLGVLGVCLVATALGISSIPILIQMLPVLILICFCFASLGILMTTFARNYDSFIYATSGFIIPMSLLSGTYFPLRQLPTWMEWLAYSLPLTHGVIVTRAISNQDFSVLTLLHVVFIVALAWLALCWAHARLQKRLLL